MLHSSVLRERYELLTILGRGSGGTVYKALDRHRAHLEPSSRCVALRVLRLNYRDSPDALAELERQFHQAQSLSHPNIVNVFDLDRDGATYFLVMEFLEGELLDVLRPVLIVTRCSANGLLASSAASAPRWPTRIVAASCTPTFGRAM